ncbi:hypothetical protein HDK90DRAFT_556591 [Phyllosticta capitalensis]|uniref:BTB domain-containing protein n=2 Tax=Phyllosticta capitalensis TaxID=121624 RepID=A0ABR1YJK5_9PEZI
MSAAPTPAIAAAPTSLKLEYNRMFTSGEYSDLAVKLSNGAIVRVHKAVVCRGADFFRHAVSNIPQGDQSNVVEMLLDPPTAVRAMLQFLYIGDYGEIISADESDKTLRHLQIFLISDKYRLPSLQTIAKERFEKALMHECLNLIDMLPKGVELAYHKASSAHIWARELLTTKCAENLQVLTQSDEFPVLLGRFNTFAFDIAKAAAVQQKKSHAEALEESEKALEATRAALKKSEGARRQLEQSLSTTKATLQQASDNLKRRDAELARVQGQLDVAQRHSCPDRKNTVFRCPNVNCHEDHVPNDFDEDFLECLECQRSYEVWKWFLN